MWFYNNLGISVGDMIELMIGLIILFGVIGGILWQVLKFLAKVAFYILLIYVGIKVGGHAFNRLRNKKNASLMDVFGELKK